MVKILGSTCSFFVPHIQAFEGWVETMRYRAFGDTLFALAFG